MNDRIIISTIYEKLQRNSALKYEELYNHIEKVHRGIDRITFLNIIMAMELQGLIRVYGIFQEKKIVEVLERK